MLKFLNKDYKPVLENPYKARISFRMKKRTPLIALMIGITIIAFYFLPANLFMTGLGDYSYCLHKQILGFGCPGCGLTRATYYLLHGNFTKAIELNFAVIFVIPISVSEIIFNLKTTNSLKRFKYLLYIIFCFSLFTLYLTRILNF
jgi:hypothetical protein